MHGYGEFAGYDQLHELIRHTVRKGSIVIYPRWQTERRQPVPGPVRHRAVHAVGGAAAIRGGSGVPARGPEPGAAAAATDELLRLLLRRHHHRQPGEPLPGAATCPSRGRSSSRTRTTAASPGPASRRSTTRWRASRRASGCSATPAREGVISEAATGPTAAATRSSRSSGTSRARNKDLVLTSADTHGEPDLLAPHGVCAGPARRRPTPTTGTSAGRSGTRCAAARFSGRRLPLRAGRHAPSTAPTAAGATASRSPR